MSVVSAARTAAEAAYVRAMSAASDALVAAWRVEDVIASEGVLAGEVVGDGDERLHQFQAERLERIRVDLQEEARRRSGSLGDGSLVELRRMSRESFDRLSQAFRDLRELVDGGRFKGHEDSCSARAGEAASSARRTVQATLPELMRKEVGEKLDRLIELYEREHPRMAIDLSSQGESLRNAWKVTVRKRHDSTGSRS